MVEYKPTYSWYAKDKQKAWKIGLGIGAVAILIWLYWSRETTEWFDEVPHRFRGTWNRLEDSEDLGDGMRSIRLSAKRIVLDEEVTRTFPIRKVSITSSRAFESGRVVVFYGPTSDYSIAKFRIEFLYVGTKQLIDVFEIVPTGWGEDHWFEVGEFAKVN